MSQHGAQPEAIQDRRGAIRPIAKIDTADRLRLLWPQLSMTLRQLEIFSAIVETGRFRAAAEKLYVAQPSISHQIQMLEEELGERLFVRSKNRRVYLTEAGRILKDHADLILKQAQVARMEVSALSKEPSGRLRLGIGGHQLTSMCPPALSAFHARFPKVCVDIVNGTTPQLVESLKANRLDAAIVTFPIQAGDLSTEVLFSEEMVVLVRRSDPLARRKSIRPTEISGLPLVLYDASTSARQRLDVFFREAKITPKINFELSSVEAMKRMVEAGMGATIVPYSAVLGDRHNVHVLRIQGRPLTRQVGMAVAAVSRLPRVLDVMLGLIRERFDEIKRALDSWSVKTGNPRTNRD